MNFSAPRSSFSCRYVNSCQGYQIYRRGSSREFPASFSVRCLPIALLLTVNRFKGLLLLHLLTTYSSVPSASDLASSFTSKQTTTHPANKDFKRPDEQPNNSLGDNEEIAGEYAGIRENATFVTLARNHDIYEVASSIHQVEDRFNHKYHYNWVFLNDDDFNDEFKEVTQALVSGKAQYGKIPKEHWSYPEWIDQNKAAEARHNMKNVVYGGSASYRHMCRFESGFFFRHDLLKAYDYYWRVEPSIEYFCDIPEDPFTFMRTQKKKYGFVISLHEYRKTVVTLWDSVKKYMKENPNDIAADNLMGFVSDDNGETYNMCHFVSHLSRPIRRHCIC